MSKYPGANTIVGDMTTLRRAFLAMSIGWAVLLPVAPFAASQPAPAPFWYGLAFVVYGAGSFICHQLPARSFHTLVGAVAGLRALHGNLFRGGNGGGRRNGPAQPHDARNGPA